MCKTITHDNRKVSKRKEGVIMNIFSHIKEFDNLIEMTKSFEIVWIKMEYFKSFLANMDKTLTSFNLLHKYLENLQQEKFIFDCSDTYMSIHENEYYIFAKSKISFQYRIDKIELSNIDCGWEKMNIPSNMLLRMRNAIDLIAYDDNESDCEKLISAIE